MLPLDIDPKLAWALKFRDSFPVDVNRAPRELLLRVPGLGAKAVNAILAARRWRRLRLDDVARLTVSVRSCARSSSPRTGGRSLLDRPRRPAACLVKPQRRCSFDLFAALTDARRPSSNAEDDFDGWRAAARMLAAARACRRTRWCGRSAIDRPTCSAAMPWPVGNVPAAQVPRDFVDLASRAVVCHSDPRALRACSTRCSCASLRPTACHCDDRADRWCAGVEALDRSGPARHAQDARLRPLPRDAEDDGRRFVAWFEPEHHIVRANAAFFVDRFTNMRWSILTPTSVDPLGRRRR